MVVDVLRDLAREVRHVLFAGHQRVGANESAECARRCYTVRTHQHVDVCVSHGVGAWASGQVHNLHEVTGLNVVGFVYRVDHDGHEVKGLSSAYFLVCHCDVLL